MTFLMEVYTFINDKCRESCSLSLSSDLIKHFNFLFFIIITYYLTFLQANVLEKNGNWYRRMLKMTGGYPENLEKEPPLRLMWTLFYLTQVNFVLIFYKFSYSYSYVVVCKCLIAYATL